ncbi:uncharacterized protein LOC128196696 [Vigna angularis]|uniref:uncharacterized protein LOC128196696 n=1 Tax=Phaseolus angularis TaxID=3914 RepID=UPI0022B3493E|nr:uncharacterized protein LOC128196696 [Vigna angularis]
MEENFQVVFHHGGKFINEGKLNYEGESTTLLFDPNMWSYFLVVSVMKGLDYDGFKELWYCVGGGSVLENRLEPLLDDIGAMHMITLARLNGEVHLFVVHTVFEPDVIHLLEYASQNTGEVETVEGECEQQGGAECQQDSERQCEVPGNEGERGQCDGMSETVVVSEEKCDDVVKGEIETQVGVAECEGDAGDVRSWSSSGEDVNDHDGNDEVNYGCMEGLVVYWSRSRFSSTPQCDTLVNNMSEAFNSVMVHTRSKPIISMLEDICLYLMKRWATNRTKIQSLSGEICPKIKTRLNKESRLTKYWIPSWPGNKLFEVCHVSQAGDKFVVNLDQNLCTCKKWAITGIPCCHSLGAMKFLNLDVEDFIPCSFRMSTYEEIYSSIVYPINGNNMWEITTCVDVLPPPKRILPGRPKRKRRLEQWELVKDDTRMRKGGLKKRCGICKKLVHNRTSCTKSTQTNDDNSHQTQETNPSTQPMMSSSNQDEAVGQGDK